MEKRREKRMAIETIGIFGNTHLDFVLNLNNAVRFLKL